MGSHNVIEAERRTVYRGCCCIVRSNLPASSLDLPLWCLGVTLCPSYMRGWGLSMWNSYQAKGLRRAQTSSVKVSHWIRFGFPSFEELANFDRASACWFSDHGIYVIEKCFNSWWPLVPGGHRLPWCHLLLRTRH